MFYFRHRWWSTRRSGSGPILNSRFRHYFRQNYDDFVPRDIYMDSLDNKINSAYNTGGLPLEKVLWNKLLGCLFIMPFVLIFPVLKKLMTFLVELMSMLRQF